MPIERRSYQNQIIDAVRSVNKALGGSSVSSYSTASRSDYNQYEVQLIDAIRSIGRTLSGGSINTSQSGSGAFGDRFIGTTKAQLSAAPQSLTGIKDFTASGLATIGGGIKLNGKKKIWFGEDHYLELVNINEGNESADPVWAFHMTAALYSDSFGSFAGLSPGGGGGGGGADLSDVWESLSGNSDAYANRKINAHHIPLGNGLGIDGDGNIYMTAVGGVSSVAGLTGDITKAQLEQELGYALKTVKIIGGTGISVSGTGTLEQDRTVAIEAAYVTKIDHGEAAYNMLADFFEKITSGNYTYIHIKNNYGFVGDSFGSFGGYSPGGGGGGGLIEQIYRYNDLGGSFSDSNNDTFDAYAINSLHLRISALEASPGTTYYLTINGTTRGDSVNGAYLGTVYGPESAGTEGYGLIANSSGIPTWTNLGGIYLPLTGGTLTGSLNIGDSSHTSAGLVVYGATEHKDTITMANNKAIMWMAGSYSYAMLTVNSSNQFVVGNPSMASFYRGYTSSFTYGSNDYTGMILNQYGGLTIGSPDLAGQAYKLYVNGLSNLGGDTTVNGTFTVGSASSYKKTTLYGALDVYGDLTLGSSIVLPNNKPIKWVENTQNQNLINVINYNDSNQVVLGSGLIMNTSGNTTLGASDLASSTYKLYVNGESFSNGSITLAQSGALKWLWSNTAYTFANIDSSNNFVIGNISFNVVHNGYTHTFKYQGGYTALSILSTGRTRVHNGLEFSRTDESSYPTAYIDYDSSNHAFHFHGSLYADGFVSSGGLGSGNNSIVTVAGDQTISGSKTFSASTTFNNSVSVNANYTLTASRIASNLITPASGNCTQMASASSNYVWIGANPSSTSYKLYVSGGAYSTVGWSGSDIRLKTDIERMDYEEAIKIVMALKPSKWTWNDNSTLAGHRSAGLIAQEVLDVMPCAVHGDDYLALNYSTFVAPVIATLKGQAEQIKELKAEVEQLRKN